MNAFLSEISPLLIAITSFILGFLMIPVGTFWTLLKPFYDNKHRPFKKMLKRSGMWFLKVLYQIWVVIKYSLVQVGYIVDLYGNVLVGELIEDIVTAEEDTLFGKGDVTISAALGDLKRRDAFSTIKLFGKERCPGMWLCNTLSKLDKRHEDHCIAAIEIYEFKQSLKQK